MPRRFQFSLVGTIVITLVAASLWFCYSIYTADRDRFRNALHLGMTQDEVKSAVGDPDETLAAGAGLPAWGSASAKSVGAETWVYFVVPKSQHRFVLTFEDARLAKIDYAAN